MTGYSKRTCGRANRSSLSCDSVFFPVGGEPYSQVCGRIRAYQYGVPEAFSAYKHRGQTTIDSAYISGVAAMYGSPRQHIWTFTNGARENDMTHRDYNCPCDTTGVISIPLFVGEDYFCESGYVYISCRAAGTGPVGQAMAGPLLTIIVKYCDSTSFLVSKSRYRSHDQWYG